MTRLAIYLIPESQNSLHKDSAQLFHEVQFSIWMITKASHLEKECSICAICEEPGKQRTKPWDSGSLLPLWSRH